MHHCGAVRQRAGGHLDEKESEVAIGLLVYLPEGE